MTNVLNRRTKTIDLKGKEYATVPARIKEFRESNPRGLIETIPTTTEDNQIMFKARVLKDKKDPSSAESTGHAMGKNTGDKAFEKLETIAIGRALATLGYLAGGDIASSEEMEEFNSYKIEQLQDAIDNIKATKTIDQLKEVFMGLGNLIAEQEVIAAKDKRKEELLDENS
jgi:hypothetical protein